MASKWRSPCPKLSTGLLLGMILAVHVGCSRVNHLYGDQIGGRVSYGPKNKGKPGYRPMLTFIAETRE